MWQPRTLSTENLKPNSVPGRQMEFIIPLQFAEKNTQGFAYCPFELWEHHHLTQPLNARAVTCITTVCRWQKSTEKYPGHHKVCWQTEPKKPTQGSPTKLKTCQFQLHLLRRHYMLQLASFYKHKMRNVTSGNLCAKFPLDRIGGGCQRTVGQVCVTYPLWKQETVFLGVSGIECFCCNEMLSPNRPFQHTTAWANKAWSLLEATSSPCYIIWGQWPVLLWQLFKVALLGTKPKNQKRKPPSKHRLCLQDMKEEVNSVEGKWSGHLFREPPPPILKIVRSLHLCSQEKYQEISL